MSQSIYIKHVNLGMPKSSCEKKAENFHEFSVDFLASK